MHNTGLNTNQIMRQVIYALALGVSASYIFFGWGIIIQILLQLMLRTGLEQVVFWKVQVIIVEVFQLIVQEQFLHFI